MNHHRLPPHELRIARAWPLGEDPADGLAVEVEGPDGSVRSGHWRNDSLELLPVGSDPKLAALEPLAREGTVVSHRYRRRAVVRVAGAAGPEFVKVIRRGRAAAILAGIERAAAFGAGFRMPEVLGSTEEVVRFSELAGRSLHDEAASTAEEWRTAWDDVARAIVHTQQSPHDAPATPRHSVADEIGVLHMWRDRATPWIGDAAGLAELVDDAAAGLRGLGEHSWVPTHRDLHDKQLLWDPEAGPGLLDVDTACVSHPALDLGNLRAHAHWRVLQGVWSQQAAAVVRECVDSAAESLRVDPAAVSAFERATLVRICCVYAFRPAHAHAAQKLQELLGRG